MYRVLILFCSIQFCFLVLVTAKDVFSAHSVGESFANCLVDPTIGECFQREALRTLDILLDDNSTWHYSEFIEFEKDTNFTIFDVKSERLLPDNVSLSDVIGEKLLQLVQARSIRMKMNPKALQTKLDSLDGQEGRKKKDKKGGMAMMGGMAMIAMMAQMFLGKVLLIAGAAFVMSKTALLLSVLTSLKAKLNAGGSTDHVVTIDHGHGGGGHSGWHRSSPYITSSSPNHYTADNARHEEEQVYNQAGQVPEYYTQHDTSSQKDDYKFI